MSGASNRPKCFEFAMDFLGNPEEPEIRAYIEQLERQLERMRKAVDPGECPCECCKDHDGIYWSECYCGNSYDNGRAAIWCAFTNAAREYQKEE